jgi:hypothetical protein
LALSGSAETLLFLHIPKTGGISLSTALTARFPGDAVFHVVKKGQGPIFSAYRGSCDDFRALPEPKRARFRCIIGHYRLKEALHDAVPGPWGYVTVLRDPVSRVASRLGQFNRIVMAGKMEGHQTPIDLATLAEVVPGDIDNHQTRFLCGGGYAKRSPEENLQCAKENLRNWFRVVGTTERIDETLGAVQGVYGWDDLAALRLNTAKNVEQIQLTQAERTWVRERNTMDSALHEFANELLDDQVSQLTSQGRWPELRHSPPGPSQWPAWVIARTVHERVRDAGRCLLSAVRRVRPGAPR